MWVTDDGPFKFKNVTACQLHHGFPVFTESAHVKFVKGRVVASIFFTYRKGIIDRHSKSKG